MADIQSTQTRPKFQYRVQTLDIAIQLTVYITATFAGKVQKYVSDNHPMVLVSCLLVQEACHV